jgi:hypothetical protein
MFGEAGEETLLPFPSLCFWLMATANEKITKENKQKFHVLK